MDIDSDLSNESRGKAIEYVQHRYGEKAVCGIITMNALAPKGAVTNAARFFGLKKYGEGLTRLGSAISKDVPDAVGVSFATTVDSAGNVADEGISLHEFLKDKYKDDSDALTVLDWARVLEGAFTAYGAHAAGIVISDNDDVSEYLPLRANSKLGLMTTQCDMVQVEEAGLLKFDFLGLKTLDIITGAIKSVEKNFGIIVDPLKIDLNDSRVYKNIFSVGKTNSVFQFESDGMKSMLKRFKPESFEDLILLVAAYRPGPLQYLDDVIDVKSGVKPVSYVTPELEPILSMTYGATIYQEQVMEICQKLAGYSLGQADNVRRFMSKKKVDKLAHEKESFIYGDEERGIPGCVKNGIAEEAAETIFEQMMEFAKYAFNKSHAAAYAFNAYITAWLKEYYPAEFFAAALNWTDNKGIRGLIYEAKSCNVKVKTPDINVSEEKFVAKNGIIRFGLSNIAGVKNNAKDIIEERAAGPFTSIKDFCTRVNPKSNVLEALIFAGAMDSFSPNRQAMLDLAEKVKDPLSDLRKKNSFITSATFVRDKVEELSEEALIALQEDAGLKAEIKEPTTVAKLDKRIENATEAAKRLEAEIEGITLDTSIEESKTQRMKEEYNLLGTFVSSHPLDYYPTVREVNSHTIGVAKPGQTTVYGVITRKEVKKRKKDGKEMAFFTLEDRTDSIEAVLFVKEYEKFSKHIEDGNVVVLGGNCEEELVEFGSDDGETETKVIKKIFVKNVSLIKECPPPFIMTVKSLYLFHLDAEKDFIELYHKKKGHKFFIRDLAMNEIREMDYKVSDDALLLDAVEQYSF